MWREHRLQPMGFTVMLTPGRAVTCWVVGFWLRDSTVHSQQNGVDLSTLRSIKFFPFTDLYYRANPKAPLQVHSISALLPSRRITPVTLSDDTWTSTMRSNQPTGSLGHSSYLIHHSVHKLQIRAFCMYARRRLPTQTHAQLLFIGYGRLGRTNATTTQTAIGPVLFYCQSILFGTRFSQKLGRFSWPRQSPLHHLQPIL